MQGLQNIVVAVTNLDSLCASGMVWYGMVWYGMVWYGMVWYGKNLFKHASLDQRKLFFMRGVTQ